MFFTAGLKASLNIVVGHGVNKLFLDVINFFFRRSLSRSTLNSYLLGTGNQRTEHIKSNMEMTKA